MDEEKKKELDELIRKAVERVKNMTPKELEEMLKAQAESWCRQDMD